MSDAGGDDVAMEETAAPVATPAPEAPKVAEKMDVQTALQNVLKAALCCDGLARGLHECAKTTAAPVATPAPEAPKVAETTDVQTALQNVLKAALCCDGLARGLHECAKVLDKREALFCVLAENCDEQMYVKLVEALCTEHNIQLMKVKEKKKLGEWVGLCKYDKEGAARKVVGCSCVVVKDAGDEDLAMGILQEYWDSQKKG